ncbi:MAG TPA: hypothetical protein VH092_31795 [Urbifossiella sp.]|nr:hypothetical protein [Urbifossiella sp.]
MPLGWTFLGLTALFSLGLVPRLASRFYPTRPVLLVRLAAPVIFSVLAAACFAGLAFPAVCVVAAVGTALIVRRRSAVVPQGPPDVAA